eukprot:CAMPEP_0119044798 /NCGR_PEP_ID=MMETSP1177-20130426/34668_1 /TAXON_ID=2985 /ORGANISM="Ochromonas sp, Strain CCMP1899" /LENGTH=351 /DNA_ID=CAMNT_0007015491 /DNA_START=254 /DNA_END=1309 /DNA_ORIENTATION=+
MPTVDKFDKIDIFAKEMYLSSPKVEALQQLLSEEAGREAFMKFLRTQYATENLDFFIDVDAMNISDSPQKIADQAEKLLATYLQPGCATEVNVTDELRRSIKSLVGNTATKKELVISFEAAQAETVKIMALGAFPRFLFSSTFQEYLAQNKKAVGSKTEQVTTTRKAPEVREDLQQKMGNELDKLLMGTSWLHGLLTSVENLPVCVSLAAANREMSGFPLIYVNAAFETTTGYNRSEIIGQNCRFLQVGKKPEHVAEPESIKRMTMALGEGKPVKVAITNFRKDGSPFRNLLAMKPIFDSDGEYAFVLGIQFDIGVVDASAKKMKIIDDLFRVLPNTIMSGADAAYRTSQK